MEKAPAENLTVMRAAELRPLVEHLSSRKWSDQEIIEDMSLIQNELQENFQNLTQVFLDGWNPNEVNLLLA